MTGWSQEKLAKLTDQELQNLAINAIGGGSPKLAQRCRHIIETRRVERFASSRGRHYEIALRLARAQRPVTNEQLSWWSEQCRTFDGPLRHELQGALEFVREIAPLMFPGTKELRKRLSHAIASADNYRTRSRRGWPFLQGGRADGNKPSRW